MTTLTVIFIVISVILVGSLSIYNRLIRLRNENTNAFAQIDVQLKRRYDLIPNLVEVAKKYLAHERETLEAVISARNQAYASQKIAKENASSGPAIAQLGIAEGILGGAMGRFMAIAEAYPDLKADGTMRSLTEELTSTENKISFARQGFNDVVLNYNNAVQQFPNNLIAGIFQFKAASMLESIEAPEERKAIKVSF